MSYKEETCLLRHLKSSIKYISVLQITSLISCINRTGIVSVVMSLEQAIFRIFRNPKITGCLELISSENRYTSTVFEWSTDHCEFTA
jgi:hypothetical protein